MSKNIFKYGFITLFIFCVAFPLWVSAQAPGPRVPNVEGTWNGFIQFFGPGAPGGPTSLEASGQEGTFFQALVNVNLEGEDGTFNAMNFHFPIAQLIAGNHVRGQTAPGSELPTSFYGKLFFESNGGALLTTLYQFRPPGGPLMFAAANRIRDFELPTGLPAVQVPGGWAGALQGFGTGRHLALLQFGQPAMGPDPMNPTSFDGSLALGSPPRVFPIRGTVDHLGRFHAVGGNRDALLQMSGRAFAPQIGGNAFRMEGSFQLNSYNIQLPSDAGSVLFLR